MKLIDTVIPVLRLLELSAAVECKDDSVFEDLEYVLNEVGKKRPRIDVLKTLLADVYTRGSYEEDMKFFPTISTFLDEGFTRPFVRDTEISRESRIGYDKQKITEIVGKFIQLVVSQLPHTKKVDLSALTFSQLLIALRFAYLFDPKACERCNVISGVVDCMYTVSPGIEKYQGAIWNNAQFMLRSGDSDKDYVPEMPDHLMRIISILYKELDMMLVAVARQRINRFELKTILPSAKSESEFGGKAVANRVKDLAKKIGLSPISANMAVLFAFDILGAIDEARGLRGTMLFAIPHPQHPRLNTFERCKQLYSGCEGMEDFDWKEAVDEREEDWDEDNEEDEDEDEDMDDSYLYPESNEDEQPTVLEDHRPYLSVKSMLLRAQELGIVKETVIVLAAHGVITELQQSYIGELISDISKAEPEDMDLLEDILSQNDYIF